MIETALMALATAGGAAVVEAAGTDAWTGFRTRVAGWFARGEVEQEQAVLRRLDATAAELAAAEHGNGQPRLVHEARWQSWFQDLLRSLQENDQDEAGRVLQALLDERNRSAGGASAGDGGVAAGDVHVSAEGGSFAAAVVNGNVSFNPPPMPAPPQG